MKKLNGWILRIVGYGKHEKIYKDMVASLNLKNVVFEGAQKTVLPYYQSASIFMMTSDVEGWGLTLTESLQMGVIPIAFDTFESLSDIIHNTYNGYIIPKNDLQNYSQVMINLMNNDAMRRKMAENCLLSSQKFSPDLIVDEWINVLNN